MNEQQKGIIERFLTKFPAMYSLDIAEVVGVDQKGVIQVWRELQERSKAAYMGGKILEEK
jgi:predicted transcriptional regulator